MIKNNLRISIVLETTLTSFCCDVQLKHPVLCCLQVKKPSFLLQLQSIFAWAAELQALCGIGYLSEGLESDLFYSVLLKKKVRPRVLEQSKVTAMSPRYYNLMTDRKNGVSSFCRALTKTPIRWRGKQQIRLLISICSPFGYWEIIALKRKSFKRGL